MPKQRDIREKALLSLFAHAAQKDDSSVDDSTWALTLEPEQEKINKISYKALNHQLSALEQRAVEFGELTKVVAPMMKSYELKSEARTTLALAKSVDGFRSAFSVLDKRSEEDEYTKLYHTASALNASLREFKTILENASFTAPELPKLLKSTKTLIDLTERVDYIANPLNHKDQVSISALVKATQDREDLREKADVYLKGTVENLEAIDAQLEEHLQNFSSDQIGRVERSLLRLAAYEIKVLELPKGIVINESLELARKFTTEDAVPLLNGVLDKL